MSNNCQLVVFSNKAYNAIIRESFAKDPVETGGILLGHILDNGIWIVMEVLPPGMKSIFQYAYFEYDEAFVNYLAQSVANQYKHPLDLLGLWHRHPGSMDVFSHTDDGTNSTFARQNPAGVISGLVNIDPDFRITMYHLDHTPGRSLGRPDYSVVDIEVGDDIIPEEYFELRYFDGSESNLHPSVTQCTCNFQPRQIATEHKNLISGENLSEEDAGLDIKNTISRQLSPEDNSNNHTSELEKSFFLCWRGSKKKWGYTLLAIVAVILTVSSFKSIVNIFDGSRNEPKKVRSEVAKPSLSVDSILLKVGAKSEFVDVYDLPKDKKVQWKSSNDKVATVKNGEINPIGVGEAIIEASIDRACFGKCRVVVEASTEEGPSVVLKRTSGDVKVGKSFVLEITKKGNTDITYSTSDSSVATVSAEGVVKGKKQGTANIIVNWTGGDPLKYTIKVK